jgi:hypothetical protein
MNVILYVGRKWDDRIIQLASLSQYSHAALQCIDNTGAPVPNVIESIAPGGVRCGPLASNFSGCYADIFALNVPLDACLTAQYTAMSYLHLAYDWRGILAFLTKSKSWDKFSFFCSELVASVFQDSGYKLVDKDPHKTSPGDLSKSPLLHFTQRIKLP